MHCWASLSFGIMVCGTVRCQAIAGTNGDQIWLRNLDQTAKCEMMSYMKDNTCSDLDVLNHSWLRHQMEIFSALLAICAGNSPVAGEFPAERSVTRSVDVFFDLRLNSRLSKQWWGWWFETPSHPLWRHCNVLPAWWGNRATSIWVNVGSGNGMLPAAPSHYPNQCLLVICKVCRILLETISLELLKM